MSTKSAQHTRRVAVAAVLSAAAAVLMFLDFPIPFLIPAFIKMDFSELPALLAAYSLGPLWGVAVCLVKNLINLMFTSTGGVGELANFLLGVCFVVPTGLIYKAKKTRGGALLAALVGAVCMGVLSIPLNYYLTYPIYMKFMSLDDILAAYQQILPAVSSLPACLAVFNMPFTILKGLLDTALAFLIYKPLSPLLHQ